MTGTPSWMDAKACRPEHAALFFPGGGEGPRGPGIDYGPALAICAQCPAVGPCRADAEAHGDIVDGYTTHGQVVGGCAPYKPARGESVPVMIQCYLEGCIRWFVKRSGASMYCSKECAVAARRARQALSARRRRGAA